MKLSNIYHLFECQPVHKIYILPLVSVVSITVIYSSPMACMLSAFLLTERKKCIKYALFVTDPV